MTHSCKVPCCWVGAWGSYHRGRSPYDLALLHWSDMCTGTSLHTPNRGLRQDTACCYCTASELLLRGRDLSFDFCDLTSDPKIFSTFMQTQTSCETLFFLYVIIPTKLTVESCVAWRAFTSPIAVHTDTPILAKTFLCRHRRRERESMWERESWKVCSSYLKASSYIMLSFFIFFISTCKHWQKVQMVNMCTICWASFICHAVNYVLIRCHFSFTTKFTGAEDYQSARRTSAQYKL